MHRPSVNRHLSFLSHMRVCLKLDRLKKELSKSNKSQNHWASTLGLSRGHLSEILNGRHPFPSPKTREKLLLGLNLTFEGGPNQGEEHA